MSLFGGDSAASRSQSPCETETNRSQPSSAAAPPSVERSVSPSNAQELTEIHRTAESDDDDDESVLSESGSINSAADDELPSRPNRFSGRKQTWRGFTAADRQIAASLEQIQSSDLAAHLYNAHALKQRVRRPAEELAELKSWQSRENWLKSGAELNYTDVSGEVQTNLVPARDWTAWPVPPASIPRPHKHSRRTAQEIRGEGWTIGCTDTPDAGDELRGEILATFLRQAKEQWNAREAPGTPDRETRQNTQSRSRSRSQSIKSTKSVSRAGDTDDEDENTSLAETQDEDEKMLEENDKKKRRGRTPQPESLLKPVFLADDAQAERILQPTINSILSKVEELALAIRRTRLNHFGREDYGIRSSASEFTSGGESSRHTSRISSSRSRSRSRPARPSRSRPSSRASSVISGRTSSKARQKLADSLSDSDTSSDSDVSMGGVKEDKYRRKRSRAGSTADERSPSTTRGDFVRESLMDWSEILGLAAVKGWEERVIARTTQRCTALFGESMSFLPLSEDITFQKVPAPLEYTPSTIPAPDMSSSARPSIPKRPYFPTPTLRCPHLDCYAHDKDFEYPYRVIEHCMHVHAYDPRTNDSDNEDRMVGGVHIDGFLQRITGEKSWTQRGKRAGSEKKRQKTKQEESEGGEEMADIESE
ncbi:hypothetical protein IQ06DRAFT_289992 [Phaeosphaeriaceae sp. SRC1lsM3a]|nr:hypothetical protein IQ06DRAFT_289992 [Stagonospora sp. SRC1lsM3a]